MSTETTAEAGGELVVIEARPSVPPALLSDLQDARAFAENEKAVATRRAYQSDFRVFTDWCESRDLDPCPVAPQTIAAFLAAQAKDGISASTLARRIAAIQYVHELAGHDSPTKAKIVGVTMRGIRRTVGTAKRQKAPATAERIAEMVRQCPDTLAGKRDRALLLLGFAGAFRRSEIVALTVADLEEADGGLRVTVRKSKTDQEAAGYVVPILRGAKACPVAAVKAWIETAGIMEGPIFRPLAKGGRVLAQALSTKSVAEIVKVYAERAGLDPEAFAGHSLRSGFLTSAASRGASIFKMMDISRHKSVDTLRSYVRRAEEFKDHAGEGLL
jgi:site-specific recombinase XerD